MTWQRCEQARPISVQNLNKPVPGSECNPSCDVAYSTSSAPSAIARGLALHRARYGTIPAKRNAGFL